MQRRDDPEFEPGRRSVDPPPTGSRDDELLADPPQGEHHLGRLAGYRAGKRVRTVMLVGFATIFVAVTLVWWKWARSGVRDDEVRPFQLPAGTDISDRPRVLTWSEGKARLGLSREPPGALAVELPDRTLRLAEGADVAQFKVAVEGGKTTALKVVSGAVVEELKPGAAPLLEP